MLLRKGQARINQRDSLWPEMRPLLQHGQISFSVFQEGVKTDFSLAWLASTRTVTSNPFLDYITGQAKPAAIRGWPRVFLICAATRGEEENSMYTYLDHAATTPMHPLSYHQMQRFAQTEFGNPSSSHEMGGKAGAAIEQAKQDVAGYISYFTGSDCAGETIFTSGATEANNLAIQGLAPHLQKVHRKHIITSAIEHPSILETYAHLERFGFSVTRLEPEPTGNLNLLRLAEAITPETGLLSISPVNNEIGVIQQCRSISQLCRGRGVYLHLDCSQVYGVTLKIPNLDFITLSGHKLYGPKGIGVLFARNAKLLHPVLFGGGQQLGLRPGTLNVPGIVGMGYAAMLARLHASDHYKTILAMSNRFQESLLAGLLDIAHRNTPFNRPSKILSMRFDGIHGDTLVQALSNRGVYASAGSACNEGKTSHVLRSIGLSELDAQSSVRFSFGVGNDKEQIDYAAATVIDCVHKLRRLR